MGDILAISVVFSSDSDEYVERLRKVILEMQSKDLQVEITPVPNNYQHYALVIGRVNNYV